LDQSEHYAKFLNDVRFDSGFNLKHKVTVKFSIILNLMLIVASNAGFHMNTTSNFSMMLKLSSTVQNEKALRDTNTARPPQSPIDAQSPRWM